MLKKSIMLSLVLIFIITNLALAQHPTLLVVIQVYEETNMILALM